MERYRYSPPLAWLAALCGVYDLCVNRLFLRMSLMEQTPAVMQWWRAGMFVRNLGATAAIVALSVALMEWGGSHSPMPLRRKLSTGLSGLAFLSVFAWTLVLPGEYANARFIALAAGASYMWCALCFGTATRGRGRWMERVAAASGYTLSVVAVSVLALNFLQGGAAGWEPTGRAGGLLVRSAEVLGEILYLLVTACLGWLAFTHDSGGLSIQPNLQMARGWRWWMRLLFIVLFTAVAIVSMWAGRRALGFDFAVLVYGAHRLQWAAYSSWAIAYAVIFGSAIGAGLGAWLLGRSSAEASRSDFSVDRTRQLGIATLAWVAAGYAPRVPARLLMMALGAACASRALVSLGSIGSIGSIASIRAVSTTPVASSADAVLPAAETVPSDEEP